VKLLPLQYLAYFPSAVFLEKVTGAGLAVGLLVQFGWVVFFVVAARVTFRLGVRQYSGFGG
jgi:ABC-2 type transport system permease protein